MDSKKFFRLASTSVQGPLVHTTEETKSINSYHFRESTVRRSREDVDVLRSPDLRIKFSKNVATPGVNGIRAIPKVSNSICSNYC